MKNLSDTMVSSSIEPNSAKDQHDKEFKIEEYRLSQNFEAMSGGRKEIITVPVRKPDKQWWSYIHPGEEWRAPLILIELKEDGDTFVVSPKIYPDISVECVCKYLFTCQTRHGITFLLPVKMPGPDGRLEQWNQSLLNIATEYSGQWIRIMANRALGAYEVFTSPGEYPPPEWPVEGFPFLLAKAFHGKVIDTVEHPILKKLRGEIL